MAYIYYKVDSTNNITYFCNTRKNSSYNLWETGQSMASNKRAVVELTSGKFTFPEESSHLFYRCTNETFDSSAWDTSQLKDASWMFAQCSFTDTSFLTTFDTSTITNMSYMFHYGSMTSIDLSNFNTSNVTDMSYMFSNCQSLTSLDVSMFNTSKVTTMAYMFQDCQALTSLDLSTFNTANVTNMDLMFAHCNNLVNLNISNFNTTKVTTMNRMFEQDYSLVTLNLMSFDTTNVTSFGEMFSGCNILASILVPEGTNWYKSGARSSSMFMNCYALPNYDYHYTDLKRANNTTSTGYFGIGTWKPWDLYAIYIKA